MIPLTISAFAEPAAITASPKANHQGLLCIGFSSCVVVSISDASQKRFGSRTLLRSVANSVSALDDFALKLLRLNRVQHLLERYLFRIVCDIEQVLLHVDVHLRDAGEP